MRRGGCAIRVVWYNRVLRGKRHCHREEAGRHIVIDSDLQFIPARRALVLLVLAYIVLAVAVSVINPLFESPDEIRHYRYVRVLVTERRLPIQGSETVRSQSHHPPLYYALSALLSGWVPSSHDGEFQQATNPFWGYRSFATGVDNKLQYWHGPVEPWGGGYFAALLSRWVNVAIGAATIAATYALACRSLQGEHGRADSPDAGPRLALAAAAIVAFNPQFIYLSAAINNDVIAALAGAGILLASVIVIREGPSIRNLVALGVVSGLGLLTKLQVGALGIPVMLALVLAAWQSRDRTRWMRSLLRGLIVVGSAVLIVSGWWFWRNLRLYGEPTGLRMQQALWGGRSVATNLWAIWQGLPQVWASLWGQFGYGQIPLPSWMMTGLLVVVLICLGGYALRRPPVYDRRTIGLLAIAVLVAVAAVVIYTAANPAGAMGRFLFPVLPALAVIIVGGLARLSGRAELTCRLVVGMMASFAAVALVGYLWPAVSYPPRRDGAPAAAQVGTIAEILNVTVQETEVSAGEPVFVEVTWRPLQWTEEPLAVFVHLVDEAGVLVAQRDTWPGLGRAPTTSWRAGVPFADTYRVDLPETVYTPNVLAVELGLYGGTTGRIPIDSGDGILVDSWRVGSVRVAASEGVWPNSVDISFENQLWLVGYEVTPRVVGPGESFTLTTVWRVPDAASPDLHLFAQVFDAQWRVWGSQDGGHPDWITGYVTDTRRITLIPDTPPGTYPVNVGVLAEGRRLNVLGQDGRPAAGYVALGPIRVR